MAAEEVFMVGGRLVQVGIKIMREGGLGGRDLILWRLIAFSLPTFVEVDTLCSIEVLSQLCIQTRESRWRACSEDD